METIIILSIILLSALSLTTAAWCVTAYLALPTLKEMWYRRFDATLTTALTDRVAKLEQKVTNLESEQVNEMLARRR